MENCIDLQAMVDEYFKTKSLKLRNDIIEESFMLICKRAKDRYERGSLDVDDIIQNSVVMLIARLDKYDSSRGAFTSFVYNTVDNVVRTMNKKAYSSVDVQERTSIHVDNEDYDVKALERGEEDLDTMYELVAEYGDFRDDVAMEGIVDGFLNTLGDIERYTIVHRLGLKDEPKQSMVAIARHFGYEEKKDYKMFVFQQDKVITRFRNYWLYHGKEVDGVPMEILATYAEQSNTKRRKYILQHKYGFNGAEKQSIDEIARHLGLERMQVKTTLSQSLDRIKTRLNNEAFIKKYGCEVVDEKELADEE